MKKVLQTAPELSLPLDAVTETFAILAKRRAGKSNAAVVMAEEFYDAGLPWVAIDPKGDWWGVRAAGDGQAPGLSVLVFGGSHGDVPLEPTSGRLVAELIAQQRLTCVLDVSEMTKADQRRFLTDFARELYRANTEPLHVFCEEADEYIPQRVTADAAAMVGAFETLIKRGGFRGIGLTLITQRSASLNKDVLTQVETLIAMRTPSPQDRKAVMGWVDFHAAGAEAIADLPSLGNGQAWVISPQWLDTLVKIQFRKRRTFDSGATPKVGQAPRRPTTLAQVDVTAIKQAMASTIEKADLENPAKLRARIRHLETQLEAATNSNPAQQQPTEVIIEVPVVPTQLVKAIEKTLSELDHDRTIWQERLNETHDEISTWTAQLSDMLTTLRASIASPRANSKTRPSVVMSKAESAPRRSAPTSIRARTSTPSEDQPMLRSGARRMVETLGAIAPLRVTKSQWGTLARLKTSGGTWSTYLSDIRRHGLLDVNAAGYTLTEAGFDYLGGRPQPLSANELQQHYRTLLRAGAAKMLDALIDAHPHGLTREQLGAAADITITGGTFSTYLSDLTRNGLAERRGDLITATDILIYGSDLNTAGKNVEAP